MNSLLTELETRLLPALDFSFNKHHLRWQVMAKPRLSEIKNQTGAAAIISKFDYLYDAQGQITSWTQQTDSNHPQNWALQYDQESKLTNVKVTDTITSSVLHQDAYLYDAAGNRTSEQVDGAVTGASFNNLNQLTGQSAGGKMVFSGTTGTVPAMVTVGGKAATTSYMTTFSGAAPVTTGTNTVAVVAHDVDGNMSSNNYQVVIPPSSASYTYDLNGNLLTDGTRTFGWDAKNEMVSIIYNSGPNVGNHTEFTYNGVGARVKIVERSGTTIGSGTISSTKQYVANEERDATNTVTKRYFPQGEQRIVSGVTTNYFYTFDHLGSIREMIDSSGTIQARYSYDPYGRRTKVSGSLDCDFGFTGYYTHTTSGLDLSATRAYDPNVGRFISRDPSGEGSGLNLYAYCGGNPVCLTDPSGLCAMDDSPGTDGGLLNALNPSDPFDPSNPYDGSENANVSQGESGGLEAAGRNVTAAGLGASALENFGPKVGDNLSLYTSEYARGNGSYGIVADLGKVGKALGPAGLAVGTAIDGVGVFKGQVSLGKALVNFGMGAAMFAGPEGALLGGTYFGAQLLIPANAGINSPTPNVGSMMFNGYH